MRRLIVSPTKLEINIFLKKLGIFNELSPYIIHDYTDECSILISGIGTPNTILYLQKNILSNKFDQVIQAGLAGSFNPDISPGDLIEVGEDCFADLGIDDRGKFRSLFESSLADPNDPPFRDGILVNHQSGKSGLRKTRGITVNTASGSAELIKKWENIYNPDIETMEGAAFFFVCMSNQVPCIQVRSVSNMVEPRNRDEWKTDLALGSLNKWLLDFVNISG